MKHLERITMQNFRGFKELELKDLGAVTILVGENNTGKTSVLEAVELLCNPLDIGQVLSTARGRDRAIPDYRMQLLESIEWLFFHDQVGGFQTVIQGELQHKQTKYQLAIEEVYVIEVREDSHSDAEKAFQMVMEHTTRDQHENEEAEQQEFLIAEPFHHIETRKEKRILETEMVTPVDHRFLPVALKSLTETIKRDDRSNIIRLLQSFDENIEGLELLSPDGRSAVPYIRHKVKSYVPLALYGDGIRRLIVLASAVLRAKDGILMIDEIETALHSKVLVKTFAWLMDACKEFNVQLIATTHSLEAVDALIAPLAEEDDADEVNRESLKDLVAFRLVNRDGQTTAKRFSGDALYSLRYEYGQDVR
ncbi:AAA family ATPase [Tumebacillus avium]|uniref:AAA family ATPase n=1 Tax=Tumebacillus avium TaxID=1903704 RepID=UPI0012FD8F34|nr:AAA family ATPase [Tumebacillus avium]